MLTPVVRRAFVATALAAVPVVVGAQSTAKYGPVILRLPSSTRALSLGEAYVGMREMDVLFYNPAQLVRVRGGTSVSAQRYGGGATLVSLTSATPLGQTWGIGVGAQVLDHSVVSPPLAIPASISGLTRAGCCDAADAVVGLGIGVLFKGIRFGATAKAVGNWMDQGGSESTLAGDVGVAKDVGPVSVGLAVTNIGESLEHAGISEKLPTRVTAGFAGGGLPVGPFDFGVSTAVSVARDGRVTAAIGGELVWVRIEGVGASMRLGVRRPEVDVGTAATFGGSIFVDRLTIDYAFEPIPGAGSGHRLGVRVR